MKSRSVKRGYWFSDETRKKMRYAKLGIKLSETHRKRLSEANKGHICSEETKRKISMSNARYSSRMTGKHHSEETKKKIAKAHIGMKVSEKTKQILHEIRLKQHLPLKDTSIERLVRDELSIRGYAYYLHFPILGQPDLAFPDQKIAIFCDGCYWHECSECGHSNSRNGRHIVDIRITEKLQSYGWLVLRYWEHEITKNTEEVVNEIEEIYLSFRSTSI
jgi:DNA mismatch endonuclease (patch repair protein)